MEAAGFSAVLVSFCQIRRRHLSEDSTHCHSQSVSRAVQFTATNEATNMEKGDGSHPRTVQAEASRYTD